MEQQSIRSIAQWFTTANLIPRNIAKEIGAFPKFQSSPKTKQRPSTFSAHDLLNPEHLRGLCTFRKSSSTRHGVDILISGCIKVRGTSKCAPNEI
ncbi:hypothetical protein CDAR_119151 [Caerostris darwini]|uniref:Uncharacterized protein n=1 Tax=Caerostris darwini TaxID=1538125 RepID=A0AAV4VB94_9ARAC|nr:hypothetical protein CDAR_119151 [Caerostris darwini]